MASSTGETPATPAIATITPAIGDVALPMLAESCIGRIISGAVIPSRPAISGTSGPNEKKAALPLPISMAARKTRIVMKIEMAAPEKPRWVDPDTRVSMKPRPISHAENISAATISVTTVLNTEPMPFQKLSSISMTLRKFLL